MGETAPMPRRQPSHRNPEEVLSFVRCRTLGHSWDAIPVTEPPRYGVAIDLRCEHCYTVRRDIVSPWTGALLGRRYSYPDHYQMVNPPERTDWRVLYVSTLAEHLKAQGETPPGEVKPKGQSPFRVVG